MQDTFNFGIFNLYLCMYHQMLCYYQTDTNDLKYQKVFNIDKTKKYN